MVSNFKQNPEKMWTQLSFHESLPLCYVNKAGSIDDKKCSHLPPPKKAKGLSKTDDKLAASVVNAEQTLFKYLLEVSELVQLCDEFQPNELRIDSKQPGCELKPAQNCRFSVSKPL